MNIKNFFVSIAFIGIAIFQVVYAAEQQIRATKNGIQYLTGGIGHEEVVEMRAHAKKFTLNLIFSEGEDGYSATAINVNIYNTQNELVFRLKNAKPMLYVNLPVGTYTILATNNGEKLRYRLTIDGNNNQKVILNWKEANPSNMPEETL
ncbi:hypothetical protein [Methylotenera sp.]|uniref:hypothetical protein n=1 Tax=Methylotenera sp. TaxID=2051956 RepID=UPI002734D8C1|nr:hypothetical protein [Methylotenera sp.]MDP3776007.1 hypothetical protein [Methylotenera sp.]